MAFRLASGGIDDRYWRFNLSDSQSKNKWAIELRKSGYCCPSAWDMNKVRQVAFLRFTSRPDYRYIKDKMELRKFLTDRGLMEVSEEASLQQMRDRLLRADRSPIFEKLEGLPAELRIRIYEFYFSSFPESLHRPTQPPLARLSRFMTEEVLTQFFKCCRFELHFRVTEDTSRRPQWRVAMDPGSMLFLFNMRTKDVAIMRRLKLCLSLARIYGAAEQLATFEVDLANSGSPAEVRHTSMDDMLGGVGKRRHQHKAMLAIVAAVKDVFAPVQHNKLRVAHILRVVGPMERVLAR